MLDQLLKNLRAVAQVAGRGLDIRTYGCGPQFLRLVAQFSEQQRLDGRADAIDYGAQVG